LLDYLRVLMSLGLLGYASWSDLRWREVSDWVWIIFASFGVLLTSLSIYLTSTWALLFDLGLSVGVMFTLSVVLFYFGFFGGADAKAFICLSVALPWYPRYAPFSPLTEFIQPLFSLAVFTNGVIVAASSAFYVLSKNIVWKRRTGRRLFEGLEDTPVWKKCLAVLSGYRVKISDLEKSIHLYPLEDAEEKEGKITRSLRVLVKVEEEKESVVKRLRGLVEKGILPDEVWATPGLPLILFITIGFVLTLFFGDAIGWMFKLLAS